MNKMSFEKFIERYNLQGACESVTYHSTAKTLKTKAISDDKNVLVDVVAKNDGGFPEGEFSVYDTAKLRSLLGVLGTDVKSTVNLTADKPTSIDFSDADTNVTYVLADKSVIPATPDVKAMPAFELNIDLDEKFMGTFIRGKRALNDVETFTVMSSGTDVVNVVIGYSKNNTNRVKLQTKTTTLAKLGPINFSSKYFNSILVVNADAKKGTLKISSKGLAKVEFESDNITATYYLVQIDI